MTPVSHIRSRHRTLQTITAVLAAIVLATSVGCGEEAQDSPTAASTITPAPVRDVNTVPAAINGDLGVHQFDLTMSRTGTATATLRWPNGDVSLALYLTSGRCANATTLLAGTCTTRGKSRFGDRPGVVSIAVSRDEVITVWVVNPDPIAQSVQVDLEIDDRPPSPPSNPIPAFQVADVTLSGVVFELTPEGRKPIAGVDVLNGEGNYARTDASGFYSMKPVWVCPCAAQPWVEAGTTFLWVTKDGYTNPPGTPGSVFGRIGLDARDVRIDGDTQFDIELVHR